MLTKNGNLFFVLGFMLVFMFTSCVTDEDENGIGGSGSNGDPFSVKSQTGWNEVCSIINKGGSGKEYIINISGNFSVSGTSEYRNTFGSVSNVTITLLGNNNTISLSSSGYLLNIGNSHTVIIKDLTLKGFAANNGGVVNNKNHFTMQGNSSITGNIGGPGVNTSGFSSATFIMQDNSSITNNTDTYGGGGGVLVSSGTFIMQDNASISNNITSGNGGGVYVSGAIFTMQGGSIFGNKANGDGIGGGGGGVYLSTIGAPTFNKTGGIIYGSGEGANSNTTMRRGHAIYQDGHLGSSTYWRNATAGHDINTTSNDFWLKD